MELVSYKKDFLVNAYAKFYDGENREEAIKYADEVYSEFLEYKESVSDEYDDYEDYNDEEYNEDILEDFLEDLEIIRIEALEKFADFIVSFDEKNISENVDFIIKFIFALSKYQSKALYDYYSESRYMNIEDFDLSSASSKINEQALNLLDLFTDETSQTILLGDNGNDFDMILHPKCMAEDLYQYDMNEDDYDFKSPQAESRYLSLVESYALILNYLKSDVPCLLAIAQYDEENSDVLITSVLFNNGEYIILPLLFLESVYMFMNETYNVKETSVKEYIKYSSLLFSSELLVTLYSQIEMLTRLHSGTEDLSLRFASKATIIFPDEEIDENSIKKSMILNPDVLDNTVDFIDFFKKIESSMDFSSKEIALVFTNLVAIMRSCVSINSEKEYDDFVKQVLSFGDWFSKENNETITDFADLFLDEKELWINSIYNEILYRSKSENMKVIYDSFSERTKTGLNEIKERLLSYNDFNKSVYILADEQEHNFDNDDVKNVISQFITINIPANDNQVSLADEEFKSLLSKGIFSLRSIMVIHFYNPISGIEKMTALIAENGKWKRILLENEIIKLHENLYSNDSEIVEPNKNIKYFVL